MPTERSMSKPSAQSVTIRDGVKLLYDKHGNHGPVVVLIHGIHRRAFRKPCRDAQQTLRDIAVQAGAAAGATLISMLRSMSHR